MAEEHRCKAPEQLCANNCGFIGSPATQNLCSKCYRDFSRTSVPPPSSSASVPTAFSSPSPAVCPPEISLEETEKPVAVAATERPNRCMACRKRVGLTGFKCRCGMTYCGTHRYAEKHGCSFDFKSMDRAAIAKANPVIKAEKLRKI